MGHRAEFDCLTCGACCCNPDENRAEGYTDYIAVRPTEPFMRDPVRVHRLVVFNDEGDAHLRLDEAHRCAALTGTVGRKVACSVYEVRPRGCHQVEAGSERCRQYRKERGVGPHRARNGR